MLSQVQGKERLYIVNRGKVDITTNTKQRFSNRKRLSTIEIDPSKEVFFNVYGYSSICTGLKVNLCAIARDYSICYYIDKDSLLNAVFENSTDF